MANFRDRRAIAERLRSATLSLTDPKDAAIVNEYLRELEQIAREQEAEDARAAEKARLDEHVRRRD
jgi:hypothetical protein